MGPCPPGGEARGPKTPAPHPGLGGAAAAAPTSGGHGVEPTQVATLGPGPQARGEAVCPGRTGGAGGTPSSPPSAARTPRRLWSRGRWETRPLPGCPGCLEDGQAGGRAGKDGAVCVRCPGAERGAAPAPRGALRPGVRAGSSRPWFALSLSLSLLDGESRRGGSDFEQVLRRGGGLGRAGHRPADAHAPFSCRHGGLPGGSGRPTSRLRPWEGVWAGEWGPGRGFGERSRAASWLRDLGQLSLPLRARPPDPPNGGDHVWRPVWVPVVGSSLLEGGCAELGGWEAGSGPVTVELLPGARLRGGEGRGGCQRLPPQPALSPWVGGGRGPPAGLCPVSPRPLGIRPLKGLRRALLRPLYPPPQMPGPCGLRGPVEGAGSGHAAPACRVTSRTPLPLSGPQFPHLQKRVVE